MKTVLKAGLIFGLVVVFLIVYPSSKISLEISDVAIEPIDENTVKISWMTNLDTYGRVEVNEQGKVNEIIREVFSCNNTGDMIIDGSVEDAFLKYGCSYSMSPDGAPNLLHNGRLYGSCAATDTSSGITRYHCIGDSDSIVSKKHSVVLDFLLPYTEYEFVIQATYGDSTPDETHAIKKVKFKTPAKKDEQDYDVDPFIGQMDAPVTVVVFSDFECPFCALFAKDTMPLLKKYYVDTGKIRFIFRDFPLTKHAYAKKAAEAAECAHEQGMFFEYHDMLFGNQDALDVDDLKIYALDMGLDTSEFNECMDSGRMEDEVKKDVSDARYFHVTGTPTVFINDEIVKGAQQFSVYSRVIDEELEKTSE